MRIKRIIVGILIGFVIGLGLEGVNVIFAFFMPPFFVFLPLAAIIGGCTGALIRGGKDVGMARERQDIEHLPACGVEFLTQLTKKMRYRHKVRQEVQAELAAHFEDDLKDCLTEEQREQRAEKLIADFGDMETLAVLMRRAKRRCRPLWRTVLARTFQAACVLIVCFVFYAIWFSFGEPTISIDYAAMLNRMSRPEVRNEDNAWPHYEEAIKLYISPQSPVVKKFISYRRVGRAREDAMRLKDLLLDNAQQIQVWFEKNQKYWDNLNPEQQSVVLKCFEYDWVPFPKIVHQNYNDWQTTPFHRMTEHVIRCINEDAELTNPHPRGVLSDWMHPGFPGDELREWLKQRNIPPNFLEAVSVAVLHEAIKRFSNLPKDIRGELTDVELEYTSIWIKRNEAAWREFVAGSAKPYCYRPYAQDLNDQDKSGWSILPPPMKNLRDLARLGIWHSRIDRKRGLIPQSIADCLTVVRAGSHWQGKGTLVEQLTGLSMSALGLEEILHVTAAENLSAAALRQLQRQLSQIYADGYPLMNMEGERLSFMNIVQHSFTNGGPGGGHLIPTAWPRFAEPRRFYGSERKLFMPFFTAASMAHARRDATTARINELFARESKLAGMTPYERHISKVKTTGEIIYSSRHKSRFFLIGFFMPAADRASELIYRGRVSHQATLTILALKQWRLEKNEHPLSLDELVAAEFLKELPTDPFGDGPLTYRRTDDDFILYSFGYNFTDDDGEVAIERGRPMRWGTREAGDVVFWPPSK